MPIKRVEWTDEERRLVHYKLFDLLGPEILDRTSDLWTKSSLRIQYSDGIDLKRSGKVAKAFIKAQELLGFPIEKRRALLSVSEVSGYSEQGIKHALKEYVKLPVLKPTIVEQPQVDDLVTQKVQELERQVADLYFRLKSTDELVLELIDKLSGLASSIPAPAPMLALAPIAPAPPAPLSYLQPIRELLPPKPSKVPKKIKLRPVTPKPKPLKELLSSKPPSKDPIMRITVIGVHCDKQYTWNKRLKENIANKRVKFTFIDPEKYGTGLMKRADHVFYMVDNIPHCLQELSKSVKLSTSTTFVNGDMSAFIRTFNQVREQLRVSLS